MNKKRNPLFAFLLSIIPPMGQIYNGQIKKGLILYAIGIIVPVIMLILKIPQTLSGLIIIAIFGISFYLYVIIDAVISARKQKQYEIKNFNRWYFYIIGIIIVLFLISPALEYLVFNIIGTARAFKIPTGSMEDTIMVGDRIIADMSYYKSHKPQRGDIVLYMPPHDKERTYIHRCVAIKDDNVEIKDGFLFVNGKKMNEKYLKGRTLPFYSSESGTSIIGKVPNNKIVILGDNRENAQDSRFFGYISNDNLVGKPLYIYYSQDKSRIGKYFK